MIKNTPTADVTETAEGIGTGETIEDLLPEQETEQAAERRETVDDKLRRMQEQLRRKTKGITCISERSLILSAGALLALIVMAGDDPDLKDPAMFVAAMFGLCTSISLAIDHAFAWNRLREVLHEAAEKVDKVLDRYKKD